MRGTSSDDRSDAAHRLYLQDLGQLVRQLALEAKLRLDASAGQEQALALGRLMALAEVVSLMQQQAVAFNIPFRDLSLDGFDPDRDLI